MNKGLAAGVALALVVAASADASAQSVLPSRGSFVFSAERLFGLYSYKGTAIQPERQDTQTGTQVALLWSGTRTSGSVMDTNVDAMPRLAVDYLITDGLTLGTGFGYYSATGETKTEQPGQVDQNEDLDDLYALAFAPRIGYLLQLGAHAGFWPRAGLTHITVSAKQPQNDEVKTTAFQANLEAMFFLAPVEHFAFVLGPVLDLPLSGKTELKDNGIAQPSIDVSWRSMGLVAGLAGYL